MKRNYGKILVLMALLLCLSTISVGETLTKNLEVVYNSVNLEVNGQRVMSDNILYNGTTYVPLRAIAEMLGKEVGWDDSTKTASINDSSNTTQSNFAKNMLKTEEKVTKNIKVVYNSIHIKVNGKKVMSDNILYNGITYVPLRTVAEMLDKEVGWDGETYTASINDKGDINIIDLEHKDKVEEPTGTLVVGQYDPATNFNPLYCSTVYDGYVVDLVFDRLFKRNFEGEYEGVLAESWKYSNDGRTITFKMKKNAKFSDGTPVTAHDIVFTYKVLADPSYTGRYSSTVENMKGYMEYREGKTKVFEGVVALDDYTVQFNFNEAMRGNLDSCNYSIIPRHYYGVNYSYGNTAPVKAIITKPMGSGPYVVKEFKEKEYVHLTRNDNYSGQGYLIKNIELKFYHNDVTLLKSGEINLLPGVIQPEEIEYAMFEGMKINKYPRSGYGYIGVNNQWGPTKDLKVRQALYYAFDREVFIDWYFTNEDTGEAFAEIHSHPLTPISWALDEKFKTRINNYNYNLDKAKSLLDEAGWKVNSQGFREKDGKVMELKIAAMPNNYIQEIFTYLWELDWEQELGIKLNIEYLEFNDLVDFIFTNSDRNADKWNLFFLSTAINSPDPHSIYTTFHSDYIGSGKNNISRYSNPKVDELLDRSMVITDIKEAKLLYQEIIKILNEEVAIMPVYSNMTFDVYNPKLTNFNTSSFYGWVDALKDAKITK